jgi:heme A synthase
VKGSTLRVGASSEEVQMSKWIRQFHRWMSIAFTAAVIVTFITLAQKEPMVWVSYAPLLPLALLLLTGLYLFVLPYAAKRGVRRAEQ